MITDNSSSHNRLTVVVNDFPSPKLIATSETIIEEMACAIAEAQAALFAGRYQDLECCAGRLQDLCAALKEHRSDGNNGDPAKNNDARLQIAARRVHQQNQVFAAVLRRMRRHLDALRGLINGPSLTYQAKPTTLPSHEE